jgi:hypothetical protein
MTIRSLVLGTVLALSAVGLPAAHAFVGAAPVSATNSLHAPVTALCPHDPCYPCGSWLGCGREMNTPASPKLS